MATDEFRTAKIPNFNLGGLFRFDREINWISFDEFNKLNGSGIFSIELTGNYIWSSVYSNLNPETKSDNWQRI